MSTQGEPTELQVADEAPPTRAIVVAILATVVLSILLCFAAAGILRWREHALSRVKGGEVLEPRTVAEVRTTVFEGQPLRPRLLSQQRAELGLYRRIDAETLQIPIDKAMELLVEREQRRPR